MFPTNLDLNDFNYSLPQDKIALFPNDTRDGSKLLVYNPNKKEKITHSHFSDLSHYLPNDSLLVINSTKVIPARIYMTKPTGGLIELLCVEPITPSNDPQIALSANSPTKWECIVGGRNVKEGMILSAKHSLNAHILKRYGNKAIVEFNWTPASISFAEILKLIGKIPLPPYINRNNSPNDDERYQTVYANFNGSVAAPTAGLHFSNDVLNDLKKKNISFAEVILHVGPGTFVPIENSINEHQMHSEQIFVSAKTINLLNDNYHKQNNFTVATGTTSLRTLETLFWIGVSLLNKNIPQVPNEFIIEQSLPYSQNISITVQNAFNALCEYVNSNHIDTIHCRTSIFIVPSYNIRTINALITNFHLPKSTLMLLVSALSGTKNIKDIYHSALSNNYRFLSYGDSSLLFRF
jgi:S-adenosylmethionine:tRNA ribosyltransferase-isomerase